MKSPSESTRPSTEALPGIHVLIQVLSEEAIQYCLVGELGLNYYNVPRIVHVRCHSSMLTTRDCRLTDAAGY